MIMKLIILFNTSEKQRKVVSKVLFYYSKEII